MRALTMEISPNVRANAPEKALDKRVRTALSVFYSRKYPANGPKLMARDYGMSIDMARAVLKGDGSMNSLDVILQSKNGGWFEIIPVLGIAIGESLEQHISKQRENHAEQDRRHASLARDLRALRSSRGSASSKLDARTAEVGRIVVRRPSARHDQAVGGVK